MSKVLSISMVAVLIIVSLASPYQSLVPLADTESDASMVVDDSSQTEQTDSGNAFVESTDVVDDPDLIDEPDADESSNLAPAEEPTDHANAPPADDESVTDGDELQIESDEATSESVEEPADLSTEEASEVETPIDTTEIPEVDEESVSEDEEHPQQAPTESGTAERGHEPDSEIAAEEPAVVGPMALPSDPGCDDLSDPNCNGNGGGDDDPSSTVNVKMLVVETGWGVEYSHVETAIVTIYDGYSDELVGAVQQGESIRLRIDYTYYLDISAPGYVTRSGIELQPTANGTSVTYTLTRNPGTISVTVVDARSGDVIPDAEVEATHLESQSAYAYCETDSSGTCVTEALPTGVYQLKVVAENYLVNQQPVTVRSLEVTEVTVELTLVEEEYSPFTIKLVDAETGAAVPGMQIYVWDPVAYAMAAQGVSDSDGTLTAPDLLRHRTYEIAISGGGSWDGYIEIPEMMLNHLDGDPKVIELTPMAPGTISVVVMDAHTNQRIPDAYITVMKVDEDRHWIEDLAFGRSDQAGMWTTPELPAHYVNISVFADGYYQHHAWTPVLTGNSTVTIWMTAVEDSGSLGFLVVDAKTGNPIPGVNVTARSEGIIGMGATDANGEWESGPVDSQTYYTFTFQKRGYTSAIASKSIYWSGGSYHEIEMEPARRLNFGIWLIGRYKSDAAVQQHTILAVGLTNGSTRPFGIPIDVELVPIVDAEVRLLDPVTGVLIVESISEEDGFVSLGARGEIYEGSYLLEINADGYQHYSQLINLEGDTELDIYLELADDGEPGDSEPGDGEPGDSEPGDGEPRDGEPGDGEPGEPGEGEPGDGEPGDGESGDGEPGDSEPGDGEPGDGEPGDDEPGDGEPGDSEPGEPGDGEPGDGEFGDDEPIDGDPGDGDPGDGDSGDGELGDGSSEPNPDDGRPGNDEVPNNGETNRTADEQVANATGVVQLPSAGSGTSQTQMLTLVAMFVVGTMLVGAAVTLRRR